MPLPVITITNNFHNTSTAIRAKSGDVLSLRKCNRIKSRLCGIAGCTCSGPLGERGKQNFSYELVFDNKQANGAGGIKIL